MKPIQYFDVTIETNDQGTITIELYASVPKTHLSCTVTDERDIPAAVADLVRKMRITK